jgi:hypothetical protein
MTPKDPPKFFTWVEETYTEPAQVPERLRAHMRVLWLSGAKVQVLAKMFNMPVEWVDDFVREEPRTTTH